MTQPPPLQLAFRATTRAVEVHGLTIPAGTLLKKNAMDMLNAAQTVIDRGETLWMSK